MKPRGLNAKFSSNSGFYCVPSLSDCARYMAISIVFSTHILAQPFEKKEHPNTPPTQCTYQTYQWNTIEKKAVSLRFVNHSYHELAAEEIDIVTGCTLCEQDQVLVSLDTLPPFRICHLIADDVVSALNDLLDRQVPIQSVVGYRVGKTRGDTDANGNRTIYSNHSYGTALDINSDANGLYDNCLEYNSGCRLIKGGAWDANNPASVQADGPVVEAFKRLGFLWGGEINGKQKDFMHFSPTGY